MGKTMTMNDYLHYGYGRNLYSFLNMLRKEGIKEISLFELSDRYLEYLKKKYPQSKGKTCYTIGDLYAAASFAGIRVRDCTWS